MEQKNKNVRLIGLDLDGTTLTSEKVLTPHTKEVLEKCLAEGIQVLPATGRVKTGIPEYLTQIEGMRYVILSIAASGAFSCAAGKTAACSPGCFLTGCTA